MMKLLLFSSYLFLLNTCLAGVVFDKKHFEFKASYKDATSNFELPFTNKGDKPVTVKSVKSSCVCMKVSVPQKEIAPGATGKVECVFTAPNSTGPIEKPVILSTDQGPEIVIVKVDVPNMLQLEPAKLAWKVNAPGDEKKIRVTVAGEDEVKITKVNCSRDAFTWSLKPIKEGREYEITVQAKKTDKRALGMFLIETDSPIQRHKTHSFYAVIEP